MAYDMANNASNNDPSKRTPCVEAMRDTTEMITAIMGGTDTMREARAKYLPKFPAETEASYEIRLKTATMYPAYQHTVGVMAGKPFARPITVPEEMDKTLAGWLQNADNEGRNLDTVAAHGFESCVAYGQVHFFVEHMRAPSTADGRPLSVDEERKAGMRPYVVVVNLGQLIGFTHEKGRLTQVRYMESIEQKDGDFGVKVVPQIRVLEPGKWTTMRKPEAPAADGTSTWTVFETGLTAPLTEIPFVTAYGKRTGFMTSRPPLKELAHLNIKHWQSQSDQDTLMHVARVPILTVAGVDDGFELQVGTKAAVKLPVNATMSYTEHSGAAIGAGKVSLDDLKEEMRQAGSEMMVARFTQATATEVGAEESGNKSDLQRIAQGFEDALDTVVNFMSQYRNIENKAELTVFKEFGVIEAGHVTAPVIIQAQTAGLLSKESAYEELQRRGVVSPDRTWEDEQARMEDEGPPVGDTDPLTGLPYKEPVPPTPPTPPTKK